MALIQLSKRTNSDPRPDYEQMVKEDIINGRINGEPLTTFLPQQLKEFLPSGIEMANREIISFLEQKIGESELYDVLVDHFFTLGKEGEEHAIDSWKALGLDPEKQTEIGLALQSILEVIDLKVEKIGIEELKGLVRIDNDHVTFAIQETNGLDSLYGYQASVS